MAQKSTMPQPSSKKTKAVKDSRPGLSSFLGGLSFPDLTVEIVDMEKVLPYAKNSKLHPDEQIEQIAASIREFGFNDPIAIDAEGVIVEGHGRLLAAAQLGFKQVPVIWLKHLSPEQAKGYRIAHNKLTLNSDFDTDLGEEFKALLDADFDLELTGFSQEEIDALLNPPTEGLTDPDDVPEMPEKPITQTGDIWLLGEHRVMCGDSTKAEDVGKLMEGAMAVLMATDPPYGVAYGVEQDREVKFGVIANDENDGIKLQAFLENVFSVASKYLVNNAAWYLWHAHMTQGYFTAAAAAADVIFHRQIIWVKPSLIMGRGDYHWRHELCFYGWIKGNRPPWYGDRKQDTVWEVGRENNHIHPTQKPVELFERPLRFNTKLGQIAYDPFGGSGSTLIACEKTDGSVA